MAETPYGILLTSFFHGSTGMRLQAMGAPGKDALLLGAFLTANDWANMIGLYEISLGKLSRHLPILKSRTVVMRAFSVLDQERFAHYDEESEFVWVREMARIRLKLERGQVIRNPRILTAAQNCYQRVPLNPFLSPFFDRYRIELALKHRRGSPFAEQVGERFAEPVAEPIGERSPNGATPVVRTQVLQRSSDQVPVHQASGEAVLSTRDQVEQGSSTSEEQPALSRRRPSLEPASFQTLCAIATEVLAQHGDDIENLADLTDRVKELCVARQRDYGGNLERLRGAIDGALSAYRKRHPGFEFRSITPSSVVNSGPEREDPTLRIASRGSAASIADLAAALRTDNVDELNTRLKQMAGGKR